MKNNVTYAKNWLLLFAIVGSLGGFSQASKFPLIATSAEKVGENFVKEKPISASVHSFSKGITAIENSPLAGHLLLRLQRLNKKDLPVGFDFEYASYVPGSSSVRWTKTVNSFQEEWLGVVGDEIAFFREKKEKGYFLDPSSGEVSSEIPNRAFYIDRINGIALSYPFPGVNQTLEAFDLETKQVLWSRELSGKYGWMERIDLDDSTMIVSAKGLHKINIVNGQGWDYYPPSPGKEIGAQLLGAGIGMLTGLATGVAVMPGMTSPTGYLSSNIVRDSSAYYVTARTGLTKVNERGEVIWFAPLNKTLISNSALYLDSQRLYVVNLGSSVGKPTSGTPFIASFDVETGTCRYLIRLGDSNKEVIWNFAKKENLVYMAFRDDVAVFDLGQGETLVR